MPRSQTILQVLVASPNDVADERKALEEVVSEYNETWSSEHNIRMEIVKWETHSRPGIGSDAQDVINQQIGNEYDVFLGIMWGRFGTPTNRAESGTQEEFERAYSRWKRSPDSVQVMFYFKDAGIPPSKSDPEQLGKVKNFKCRLSSEFGALWHSFESTEEFVQKARMHLSKIAQDFLKRPTGAFPCVQTGKRTTVDANPLANFTKLDESDDEEGLLDLVERANAAMIAVRDATENMTGAQTDLAARIAQRTQEMNRLISHGSPPDQREVRRVSDDAAKDIEDYVERMSIQLPEFQKHQSNAMDFFGKAAVISSRDFKQDRPELNRALTQIRDLRSAILNALEQQRIFQDTVSNSPRLTTKFNRARRRAVAILEDLLGLYRTAANQAEDVEHLLERIVESKQST